MEQSAVTLRRTALYGAHRALGARFVDFAGWEMPVQYTGLLEEHRRVRSACGLFDVSHMGEIELRGRGALEAMQVLGTNDLGRISEGRCQYTLLCYPTGGVVDDCIVYMFSAERLLVCVNASNTEKVYGWFLEAGLGDVSIRDVSGAYAQLALQGPSSEAVLSRVASFDPSALRGFHFLEGAVAGRGAMVSRTGYTGEDGFEIYTSPDDARGVWDALLDAGGPFGILPAGLGARDTLRLEMAYPLYGHELSSSITPLEAGLERFVALRKDDFIGREALLEQKARGLERTLCGLVLRGRGVPREGCPVRMGGKERGRVTSGTLSPSLGRGIALAFLPPQMSAPGTEAEIMIRDRPFAAEVVETPFYRRETLRAHALGKTGTDPLVQH